MFTSVKMLHVYRASGKGANVVALNVAHANRSLKKNKRKVASGNRKMNSFSIKRLDYTWFTSLNHINFH